MPPVAIDQHAVLRVRQILGGQPEIECVARQLAGGEARQQVVRLALEHCRVGLAEHLDVAEREVVIVIAEIEIVEPERLLEAGRVGGA